MNRPGVRPPMRHLSKGLLAAVVACCLMLMTTVSVLANTVNINDQAGVLDQNRVRSEGANLSYSLNIYTTNAFQGSSSAFQQQSASHVTSTNLIVMAIDTVNHHFYTAWGKNVPLSSGDATSAANAFKNSYNNGDYTGATVAAIQSLGSALSSRGNSSGGNSPVGSNPVSSSGGLLSGGLTTLCCVGLLILIIGAVIFGVMRRRGGMGRRMAPGGMGMGAPYQQPYPQNYYGPGGYNQGGGGMNPLAAGGLGAAAGGLVGYELGKHQGEQNQGGNVGGGDFGGGGGGDFGGGGGGDFGGGGGGGDFGGGGGGGFGGGGDSGGGGGGSF
ncbi:MAG: hypothetical protein ABI456_14325 [Ktedonobacteraceae bacterium]